MQANHDEKETTGAYTEVPVPPKAYLREVGGNAAAADPIAQQEHKVRGIAVHLVNSIDFLSLGPRLVAFIPLLHSS